MRISVKAATRVALGVWLRASASIRPDQFERPFGVKVDVDGRPLQRYVGDLDAAEQQREEAQARGQPVGGQRRLAWRRRA